ncbi:two-component sensor histidine kinase [Streptomyces spinoverrucosus]|uniref:histidine kinase n=2 Tax=Streptomyces spinoverrucosus TaxID=284043 RepID=A0A4Y3VAT0_9ACTN|nr:two-component sensor histidine kinase [Streptomyces spinoverrucosus]GHB39585.1 two-component sensor histidine kinase [Streptomyces spinoverrucosus]
MACVADVLNTSAAGLSPWPIAVVLLLGLGALLWPIERRPRWFTPQLRTAVPALVSLACTAALLVVSGGEALFGPGETTILLCLLFLAVRHCPHPWALICGVLDGAAVLALPVRSYQMLEGLVPVYVALGVVLVGLIAGLAGYLRTLDYRRAVAVGETRRSERLAIAADLHDFVAHHVTGILVQTQMARMMAADRPDELDPVLAGIERAATEALASMRRTVGVLRDTDDGPGDRRPVGDLAAIGELTRRFAGPGAQRVNLHRDTAVSDDLPHEVQAAAFRVVQEALTNVRRHAGDATEIAVGLRRDGDGLEVSVVDDGRGGSRLPDAARGGGFGLVGLKERVTALGGELHAGPRDGDGWEVRAAFPLGKA